MSHRNNNPAISDNRQCLKGSEFSRTKWRIAMTVICCLFRSGLERLQWFEGGGFLARFLLNNLVFFLFGVGLNAIFERISARRITKENST